MAFPVSRDNVSDIGQEYTITLGSAFYFGTRLSLPRDGRTMMNLKTTIAALAQQELTAFQDAKDYIDD
jgi:hypothetical protein